MMTISDLEKCIKYNERRMVLKNKLEKQFVLIEQLELELENQKLKYQTYLKELGNLN